MAFSVDDFQDLLRLLEQRPEWRTQLRRQILTDDLLELPSVVRDLAEAQRRTEARLEELAQAQTRTEQRLQELAQAQIRTEQRLTRTEQRLEELAGVVGTLVDRVGELNRDALEFRYWRRAGADFSRLARSIRVIDSSDLADLLDTAVDTGQLTDAERDSILAADLVLSGQRREDRTDAYFLVEVSVGIGVTDVARAADRALLFAKLGRPVVPVVAGARISSDAIAAADSSHVQQILDGRLASRSQS